MNKEIEEEEVINRPLHIDGDALLECMMNTKQILERERTSWLRSEIEKLEFEKMNENLIEGDFALALQTQAVNGALNTIITRYKEELKVMEGK